MQIGHIKFELTSPTNLSTLSINSILPTNVVNCYNKIKNINREKGEREIFFFIKSENQNIEF
jgi:hypothetical protein